MNIAAGLSGLKAAAEMTKALRDGLKSGQIPVDQLSGRIGEIYDYIIDSRAALVDASEEITELKDELYALKKDALVFLDGGVNWEKRPDGQYDGPLCPACWGLNNKRLVMVKNESRNHPDYVVYHCIHHASTVTAKVPKPVLEHYL
jgi:hypothetical protein